MDSYAFKVRYISRAGSLYVHVRACGETMLSWVRVRMAWPMCIYIWPWPRNLLNEIYIYLPPYTYRRGYCNIRSVKPWRVLYVARH